MANFNLIEIQSNHQLILAKKIQKEEKELNKICTIYIKNIKILYFVN